MFADSGSLHHPVDMEKGCIGSMKECGVTESYKLKRQVILSASEAAEMILRVDDSESSFFPSSQFFVQISDVLLCI